MLHLPALCSEQKALDPSLVPPGRHEGAGRQPGAAVGSQTRSDLPVHCLKGSDC